MTSSSTLFSIAAIFQLAAFGGAAHIALKTRRSGWLLLALSLLLILLYRLLKAGGLDQAHLDVISLMISSSALLSVVYIFRRHSREVEELQALADVQPHMVWVANAGGEPIFTNYRWMQYTGLTVEASRRWNWLQSVHPDDRQRVQDAWLQSLQRGTPYQIEERIKRFDGEYRWHLVKVSPVFDRKGKLYRWYGSIVDIHDYKLNEELLRPQKS